MILKPQKDELGKTCCQVSSCQIVDSFTSSFRVKALTRCLFRLIWLQSTVCAVSESAARWVDLENKISLETQQHNEHCVNRVDVVQTLFFSACTPQAGLLFPFGYK